MALGSHFTWINNLGAYYFCFIAEHLEETVLLVIIIILIYIIVILLYLFCMIIISSNIF